VSMSQQFMGRHKPIQATGRSAVQEASPMFTVHIARVRLDRETGAYQLTGYAAIQDVGHAINPPEVEAQVHGAATQPRRRARGGRARARRRDRSLASGGDQQQRTVASAATSLGRCPAGPRSWSATAGRTTPERTEPSDAVLEAWSPPC